MADPAISLDSQSLGVQGQGTLWTEVFPGDALLKPEDPALSIRHSPFALP
jgi:hypothetical protein